MIIHILIGIMVGAPIGFAIAALCYVAKEADK